ncbi:MAG: type II secretion system F family protein [Acidobacteriota bacterium]
MPKYEYQAKNELGQVVSGSLRAADERQLYSILRNTQLYLISSKAAKRAAAPKKVDRRIKRRDLINFSIQLSNILSAGVPLNLGLGDIAKVAGQDWLKTLMLDLKRSIEMEGLSMSDAMARHPKVFSPVYVSMIRAGEKTGNVDKCLDDLAEFLEWQDKLINDTRQATVYPAIILSAVSILCIVLLTVIFPKFLAVMVQLNMNELPLPTRILLGLSNFAKASGIYALVLLISSAIGLRIMISYPAGRLMWDRFKLSLPVLGDLIQKVALSRFANYFAMLARAGVDVMSTLRIIQEIVGNTVISGEIHRARERVLTGATLSESLALSAYFPPLVIRMVHLGETTGEIDQSLERVKTYYDREVSMGVSRLFALIEPTLLIAMACVILFVALALYLPMWDILGSINTR